MSDIGRARGGTYRQIRGHVQGVRGSHMQAIQGYVQGVQGGHVQTDLEVRAGCM